MQRNVAQRTPDEHDRLLRSIKNGKDRVEYAVTGEQYTTWSNDKTSSSSHVWVGVVGLIVLIVSLLIIFLYKDASNDLKGGMYVTSALGGLGFLYMLFKMVLKRF